MIKEFHPSGNIKSLEEANAILDTVDHEAINREFIRRAGGTVDGDNKLLQSADKAHFDRYTEAKSLIDTYKENHSSVLDDIFS